MSQKNKNNNEEKDSLPTSTLPVSTGTDTLEDDLGSLSSDVMKAEMQHVEDVDSSSVKEKRKEELAKVSAKLGNRTYEFPCNDFADIRVALYLSQYFQKENLQNGQILTYNFHANQMLFLPELGMELSQDNPSFTYNAQTFHEYQEDYIIDLIRKQALILGDYGVKKKPVKMSDMSSLDYSVMLDKPERELFRDIKSLAQQSTSVNNTSGEVTSPVPVLKGLYQYERNHKSRKKILSMINRALNHVAGSVHFLDKMTDIAPAGTKIDNPQQKAVQKKIMTAKPSSNDF